MSSRSTSVLVSAVVLTGCFGDPEINLRITRPTTSHAVQLRACEIGDEIASLRCSPEDLRQPNANAFGENPGDLVEETLIYVGERYVSVNLDLQITNLGSISRCVPIPIVHGTTTRRLLAVEDVPDPANPLVLVTTATWSCPDRPDACEVPREEACPP